MGTRGLYGFRKDGVDKVAYNHCDSYPSGLGVQVAAFCENTNVKEMVDIFDNLILVHPDDVPTSKQIRECDQWKNLNVSTQNVKDWYCLIREAQGDMSAFTKGLRYMFDAGDFIKDSLFCEWAYIVNLDTDMLEVWKGFQHEPDKSNRYGQDNYYANDKYSKQAYYPCALIAEYPLETVIQSDMLELEKE